MDPKDWIGFGLAFISTVVSVLAFRTSAQARRSSEDVKAVGDMIRLALSEFKEALFKDLSNQFLASGTGNLRLSAVEQEQAKFELKLNAKTEDLQHCQKSLEAMLRDVEKRFDISHQQLDHRVTRNQEQIAMVLKESLIRRRGRTRGDDDAV